MAIQTFGESIGERFSSGKEIVGKSNRDVSRHEIDTKTAEAVRIESKSFGRVVFWSSARGNWVRRMRKTERPRGREGQKSNSNSKKDLETHQKRKQMKRVAQEKKKKSAVRWRAELDLKAAAKICGSKHSSVAQVVAAPVHVRIGLAPKHEKQIGAICENVLEGINGMKKRKEEEGEDEDAVEDRDE